MARRPAYALATILVLLGVALFSAGALVSVATLESKISLSSAQGVSAYYAAEAGIEDALWKLNHDDTYKQKLGTKQFSPAYSYTLTDLPSSGLGSTVTITSTNAGYATVVAKGYSNNGGSFVATRTVQVTIFQSGGSLGGSLGNNAVMAGGTFSMSNANTDVKVTGGDFYAGSDVTINLGNKGTFDIAGQAISTSGNYSGKGTITYGTLNTSVPASLPPGIDFSNGANGYANPANYTTAYDMSQPAQVTQFQTAIMSSAGLPGPITYVNGNLDIGSWAKGATLKINGLLVVNGSFSLSASSPSPTLTITDPGSHVSGIVVNGAVYIGNGTITMTGVLFATSTIQLSDSQPISITGAMVAGGSITVSTGGQITLNFSQVVANATMTGGDPYSAAIQHWEEEY